MLIAPAVVETFVGQSPPALVLRQPDVQPNLI
jgi:hypothetical protein